MSEPGQRRRKRLSYRALGVVDLAAHTEFWRGYEWQAGPWVVRCIGAWGEVQVWAASEPEGRRVATDALTLGGWPLPAIEGAEWIVSVSQSGRLGRPGTCRLADTAVGFAVRIRDGSDGPSTFHPYWLDPD